MDIVKINKETLEELLGALAAFSISSGGNPYIDKLIETMEKEMEELNNG